MQKDKILTQEDCIVKGGLIQDSRSSERGRRQGKVVRDIDCSIQKVREKKIDRGRTKRHPFASSTRGSASARRLLGTQKQRSQVA